MLLQRWGLAAYETAGVPSVATEISARLPQMLPVERIRGDRPREESWRADAFSGSRHTRLADELRLPLEDFDAGRALQICGQICRQVLLDFAPALLLLPATQRRRTQVLIAYVTTLFDFALQTGIEGERLAGLGGWEFNLERMFDGERIGQPIFLLLAEEEQNTPWPREAFTALSAAARTRIIRPRPETESEARAHAGQLLRAVTSAFWNHDPEPQVREWGISLLRLSSLMRLGEDVRRHRPQLSLASLPRDWDELPDGARLLRDAIGKLCAELEESLRKGAPPGIPSIWRAAANYIGLAAIDLFEKTQRFGDEMTLRRPQLGAARRLWLVLQARLRAPRF